MLSVLILGWIPLCFQLYDEDPTKSGSRLCGCNSGPELKCTWLEEIEKKPCNTDSAFYRLAVSLSLTFTDFSLLPATPPHSTWPTGASVSATPASSSAPRTTTPRGARKTGRFQVRFVWSWATIFYCIVLRLVTKIYFSTCNS